MLLIGTPRHAEGKQAVDGHRLRLEERVVESVQTLGVGREAELSDEQILAPDIDLGALLADVHNRSQRHFAARSFNYLQVAIADETVCSWRFLRRRKTVRSMGYRRARTLCSGSNTTRKLVTNTVPLA